MARKKPTGGTDEFVLLSITTDADGQLALRFDWPPTDEADHTRAAMLFAVYGVAVMREAARALAVDPEVIWSYAESVWAERKC